MFKHSRGGVTIKPAAHSRALQLILTALLILAPLSGISPAALAGAEPAFEALAAGADFVSFPSPEVEFIIGPQLKSGSALNPAPWFDQNAFNRGLQLGEEFPATPPGATLSAGTVSVTRGSKTVVGTGTRFLTDFAGGAATGYHVLIRDGAGVTHDYILTAVTNDTHLTVSVAWQQPSASGLAFSKVSAADLDAYVNLNYYDQGLVQYVNYYRTGDARFLGYARKIADSWWQSPFVGEGRTEASNSFAPRNSSLTGLMLRAVDGRAEMWPWITAYVREQFFVWCERPLSWYRPMTDGQIAGTEPEPNGKTFKHGFYAGVRDPGYMLLHATNLARIHPDPAVRDEFRAKVLDVAVNYYARLQRLQSTDGGFYFEVDPTGVDYPAGLTTQPFQEGLLGEGLIAVHRLTNDATVRASIVKLAEHLYHRAYNRGGWRAMYYFVGGQFANGTSCETGCGAASNSFPPSDASQVAEARQLNTTAIHVFGYAYLLTGDAKFKTWGDDALDSTYSGQDGYRGLAWARAKEYDEAYRSAGKYIAWRLSGGTPLPTPSPTPTPTSTPTPVPTSTPPLSGVLTYGGKLLSGSAPVTGRRVVIYDAGGDPIGSVTTNAEGRYNFEVNSGQQGTIRPEAVSGDAFSPSQYSFTVSSSRNDLDFVSGAPTPTPTPTPTAEPKAQLSLREARRDAQDLSNDLAATAVPSGPPPNAVVTNPADSIAAVVAAIQRAYLDFGAERSLYPAAGRVETSLSNALTHAAAASTYAGQNQLAEARSSLQKAIDYLELADVLMVYGDVENPVDYSEYFVRQHYVDFLGREPDESGRAYWTSKIKNCGASAQCAETMRIDVSAAYYHSIEFKETGYVVYRLYRGSLGRTVLFEEFLSDTREVGKGVIVGETGWRERLTANKAAFYQAWVRREDFRARYDRLTDAQFVDSLYASMGVVPASAERDSLIASLGSGAARADVLAKVVESEEFSRLEFNKAFVLMQYFGYLRRNPDTSGYNHWLGKLEQFGGDYQRAEMVKAFLSSTEYRDRFRQQ